MADINEVTLIGRVGKDPERKTRKDGKEFSSFSLATSKGRGETQVTQWHRITVWNEQTAKFVNEYVTAGTLLYVRGEIVYGQYEQDGVTKYSTDIWVPDYSGRVEILKDSPTRGEGARAPRSGGGRSYAAAKVKEEPPADSYDDLGGDEIPF